jgi:hypothetical protein
MKEKGKNTKLISQVGGNEEKNNDEGYPLYSDSEDIFNKSHEEKDINPEEISKTKEANDNSGTNNEKNFKDDISGSDLDVPGSELDDEQENMGSEDEENNFYSLGGDDHENLDEDNNLL